jgi:hypothetical protein
VVIGEEGGVFHGGVEVGAAVVPECKFVHNN